MHFVGQTQIFFFQVKKNALNTYLYLYTSSYDEQMCTINSIKNITLSSIFCAYYVQ